MKQLFLIVALALSINAYAQDDKTVTLVVSGQGKTQDEAKQNALRSAIEQAFGTFISSKTEILNDNLVKDEIVSITNGNIQKYELLSEGFIPDGNYSVTLRAIVSISKLSNFCESKGIEILFNGDLLSSNIQLIEMNKDAELISMKNLIKSSKDWLKKCFDYSLKTSEPTSLNGRYQISLTVSTSLNSNFVEYNKYTINTLKNISMSESEIKNYNKLEIEYYQIQILDLNKVPNTYYFRNEQSLNVFFNLFEKPEVYLQNFEVSNNLESIKGIKFQKVVRTDDRSPYRVGNSDAIVVKYKFFDRKICHRRTGDGETEYFFCTSIGRILFPGYLQYNRFPIMIILNEGNSEFQNNNIRRNLLISFFCPLDQGLVSVRKFDYSFDKEKIKNISRFKVLPNKI